MCPALTLINSQLKKKGNGFHRPSSPRKERLGENTKPPSRKKGVGAESLPSRYFKADGPQKMVKRRHFSHREGRRKVMRANRAPRKESTPPKNDLCTFTKEGRTRRGNSPPRRIYPDLRSRKGRGDRNNLPRGGGERISSSSLRGKVPVFGKRLRKGGVSKGGGFPRSPSKRGKQCFHFPSP